jgi:phosphatidylinositol alpha-1,6-mannosyltransferase
MRRTLLLSYDFPPMPGGIARFLGEIAREAPPGSLVVSTGRVPGCESFDASGIARVNRVGLPSERLRTVPGLARWAWRARRLVREQATQFIWAGNLKPAGHVARWLGDGGNVPYGLVVYGLDLLLLQEQVERSRGKRAFARRIVGGAAGTVAISGWTAARFRELASSLGLGDARVSVVHPGVDTRRFRPGLGTAELRDRLGLGDQRWLLSVARLESHKGIDRGLEALAMLRAQGHNVGYLIAGEGSAGESLRRECQERGLMPYVRWLGRVGEAELPALYGVADLYLGLSRQVGPYVEGFGLALLEAQAAGLAVIAGRSAGVPEALVHGTTGILVSPEEMQETVSVTGELLRNPSRARAMGAEGRARVEQRFSWSRVLRELDEAAAGFSAGREPRAVR